MLNIKTMGINFNAPDGKVGIGFECQEVQDGIYFTGNLIIDKHEFDVCYQKGTLQELILIRLGDLFKTKDNENLGIVALQESFDKKMNNIESMLLELTLMMSGGTGAINENIEEKNSEDTDTNVDTDTEGGKAGE